MKDQPCLIRHMRLKVTSQLVPFFTEVYSSALNKNQQTFSAGLESSSCRVRGGFGEWLTLYFHP
jgi:hypothetical protein